VPDGPLWTHEIKHDGYRLFCRWDGDWVRAFTRRGHECTDRVPAIADALAVLPVTSATIDGEAVVCDSAGVSDFDGLRAALAHRASPEVFLYAWGRTIGCRRRRSHPACLPARRSAFSELARDCDAGRAAPRPTTRR